MSKKELVNSGFLFNFEIPHWRHCERSWRSSLLLKDEIASSHKTLLAMTGVKLMSSWRRS
jgi:hypothetical protein